MPVLEPLAKLGITPTHDAMQLRLRKTGAQAVLLHTPARRTAIDHIRWEKSPAGSEGVGTPCN